VCWDVESCLNAETKRRHWVLGDVVLLRWCVCRYLLGDVLPFVLVGIHNILKESYASVFWVEVQYSVCRLIFLLVHVTREVQLSGVTSQELCFMAVRMSKCRVNSALKFPLPQTAANSLVSWAPVWSYKPLCFRFVTTHAKIMTT